MKATLTHLSPLDGRYREAVKDLSNIFSEEALIRARVRVEVAYLLALSQEPGISDIPEISDHHRTQIQGIADHFSLENAEEVKSFEDQTQHDVKAVEYFLREKLRSLSLNALVPWVHFGLTSEDINNLAYSLMWTDGLHAIFLPELTSLLRTLKELSLKYGDTALLALTHGQPASPTTLGKELGVYVHRLTRQANFLKSHILQGKLGGATGTWSALWICYPDVDWLAFSRAFIQSLNLEPNLFTTQIEPHDSLVESYQGCMRVNTILLDLCRDIWMYISRGILALKRVSKEVGSSTMPHKINPIHFENAEGNLGLSNSLLGHMANKLPTSRMQRDLSDSTVLRNQGTALGYSFLALKNISKGLGRVVPDEKTMREELDAHWEVLAEALQMVLRKHGVGEAYEKLKVLTRGKTVTRESLHAFIKQLEIGDREKEILLSLTPSTYTGLASKLVELL